MTYNILRFNYFQKECILLWKDVKNSYLINYFCFERFQYYSLA